MARARHRGREGSARHGADDANLTQDIRLFGLITIIGDPSQGASAADLSHRLLDGYLAAPYAFHFRRNSALLIPRIIEGVDTVFRRAPAHARGRDHHHRDPAPALPPVLVFDEATSALDTQTERELIAAVDALRGAKTLVVVAHGLSTVRLCDLLVFLREGRVAAVALIRPPDSGQRRLPTHGRRSRLVASKYRGAPRLCRGAAERGGDWGPGRGPPCKSIAGDG